MPTVPSEPMIWHPPPPWELRSGWETGPHSRSQDVRPWGKPSCTDQSLPSRCPVQVPDPNLHRITGNHLVGMWHPGATSKSAHPTSPPLPPPRTSSAHTPGLPTLLTSARVAIAQTSIFMTLPPAPHTQILLGLPSRLPHRGSCLSPLPLLSA